MAVIYISHSTCPYTYDVIEELEGKNVTENDAMQWPCELRSFWIEIYPLVKIVRFLLSYGTSCIILSGIVLNMLSFVVLTQKHMRKIPSNMYLAFLAIYDTCTLIFNFMIGVIRGNNELVNKQFQAKESLCLFHGVIVELFNLLSVWVIVSFTVERALMTKFPMKARTWSPRKTVVALVSVSFIMTMLSLHKIAVSGFEGDSVFGYKACKTRRLIFQEIIYIYVALNTWLPALVITTFNLIIVLELRKTRKTRLEMTNSLLMKSDERIAKLLLVVSSTYLLLILPLGCVQTAELIWNSTMVATPDESGYIHFMTIKLTLKWTRAFCFFFYELNFINNFFLYVMSSSSSRFRVTLRRLLGMKRIDNETLTLSAPGGNSIRPITINETKNELKPSISRSEQRDNRYIMKMKPNKNVMEHHY